MPSYVETLKSYNPVVLFTSNGETNILDYSNEGMVGAVVSEVGSSVLIPTQMTYGGTVDRPVFKGPSLSSNELSGNYSLFFGCKNMTANDYFLTVDNSDSPDFNDIPNTNATLTLQVMVPKQTLNNQIKGNSCDTILVYDDDTLLGSATVTNRKWSFTDDREDLVDGHVALYNIRYSINGIPDGTIQSTRTITYNTGVESITTGTAVLPGKPPTAVLPPSEISATIVNTYYGNRVYISANGVVHTGRNLVLEGTFSKRIVIYEYAEYPAGYSASTTENVIFTSNALRITLVSIISYSSSYTIPTYTFSLKIKPGASTGITIPITVDLNYNIAVTMNYVSSPSKKYFYQVYVNGKLFNSGNVGVLTTLETGPGYNLTSAGDMYIGQVPTMAIAADGTVTTLTMRNYIAIDNISIHNYLLSAEEILNLHYGSLSYQSIISLNTPLHNFIFDTLPSDAGLDFTSEISTGLLSAVNKVMSLEETDNKIVPYMLNFSNKNHLLSSKELINFSNPFCFLVWIRIRSDGVILSSRNNVSDFEGLTVYVKNNRVFLESGTTIIDTEFYISDNRIHMILVQRESGGLRVVIDNVFNELYAIPSTLNSTGFVPYTSLLADIGGLGHIDADIGMFTTFSHSIDLVTLNSFFDLNVLFFINGTVTLQNYPILTEVRIYDHYTGNLLGKEQTDLYGNFEFYNNYMRSVDVMVMDYVTHKGNIQVIGPVLPLSN